MDVADFATHYYLNGQPVEPPTPTGDEDTDDANHDEFISQEGLIVDMRCTADGLPVHSPSASHAQEMRCNGGHRWIHVAPGPTVRGDTWGWRQVR